MVGGWSAHYVLCKDAGGMIVTASTKYKDFAEVEQYISDDEKAKLKAAAEKQFRNCYALTIDEFFGVTSGDYSLLGDTTDPTVLQVYWLRRFAEFCEEFTKACERLQLEPTPEQVQAQAGCVDMSPQESMLVFMRDYFGLPSFYAAGERTIGEYLTARKDKYNAAKVQRNYENMQRRKLQKYKAKK